jgi:iron complex outermembrane receptor protein
MPVRFVFFIAVCLMFQVSLVAQQMFNISGHVTDHAGNALPGVGISIHELSRGAQTDVQGNFKIPGLKPGRYHIHFVLLGYRAVEQDVTIGTVDVNLSISLQPASIELNNVTVEESMLKQSQREQSQAVTVVDRNYMLKNGNASLMRMLENVPGVNSISTGMGVSKPVIRGLSFNRVVVAENGIKQEGQQWGADHGLEIDPNGVERIEIIKGPASLLYGSDGLGGVLNIRPAPAPELNTAEASLQSSFRSVNDYAGLSGMAAVNRNNWFTRLRISAQDFADYRVPADSFIYNSYILPIVNRRLKNTAGRENALQWMAGTTQTWGITSITFSYFDQKSGFFSGAHGIPRSYQLTDDTLKRDIDLPYQHVRHAKLISNSSFLIGKSWLEVDLGYQNNHRSEYSYPHVHGKGPQPSGNLELDFILQTYSMNSRLHIPRGEKQRWVLGANATQQRNSIGGFNFLIPNFSTGQAGAFAFYRKDARSILFNAGLRFDYAQLQTERAFRAIYLDSVTISEYEQASPQLNRYFSNFSGSAGISWFPTEHLNIKYNVGSAYRIPTAPELTSNGVHHGTFRHELGDSTLRSERSLQNDILIRYSTHYIELNFSPFVNYFKDFIFLEPLPKFSPLPEAGLLYQYTQADALHYGAELQGDVHFTKHLHVGLSAQYTRGWNLQTAYYLPFMPPFQARLDAEYAWEHWGKSLEDLFLGAQIHTAAMQYEVARNEKATPGFSLMHISLGSTINVRKTAIKLVINVQNVFDTAYLAHLNRYRQLNLPEAGRNIMLTVFVPFKLKSAEN